MRGASRCGPTITELAGTIWITDLAGTCLPRGGFPAGRPRSLASDHDRFSGRYRPRTSCSWESVWLSRYPRSAVIAAMSKAASATSMTSRTPARTRVRSWARRNRPGVSSARRSRLGAIGARRVDGARQPQAVADGALGVDHVRPVPGQLAPQVGDIGGHHGGGPAEVVVPHVVEQLRPGQHPPRVEHQVPQQPELGRRQVDEMTGPADLVGLLVQLD